MTTLTKLMTGAAVAALLAGPTFAQDTATEEPTTEETMTDSDMAADDGATMDDGAMEDTALDEDAATGDAMTDGAMTDGAMGQELAPESGDMGFASLEEMTVGDLVGMVVHSPDDERIGEIDYVVVPAAGPQGVIGIGGFLGLGEYTVAIPLEDFELREDGTSLLLSTDKEALKELPEFDESGVEGVPDDTPLSSIMQASAEGEADMSTEAPAEGDAETSTEAPAEGDAAMGAEADAEADVETDTDAEMDDADAEMDAEADAEVDADAEADVETEESN